jgi:hypothetical protein
MDDSLLKLVLGSAAFLVSIFINLRAYSKLTPEQQQDVKSAQAPPRSLLVIPLLMSFWLTNASVGKGVSVGWLYTLVWAVPMLIIFAWERRRLRVRELPSGYLKSHLIMEALFIGGVALIFLIL